MVEPFDMLSIPLVREARDFADWAHGSIDQRRKYTNEPYIVHPGEVAALVATVDRTPEVLAAAWLHDTVEDVPHVTHEIIRARFGEDVGQLVFELTDRSTAQDGTRDERKALDRLNLWRASPRAKTVKLGDLISNTRSIGAYDPKFARVYIREKALVLCVLTEGHPALLGMAFRSLIEAADKLKLDIFELANALPRR